MNMERTKLTSPEQAASFYRRVADETARSILDYLIDHPEERFDGAALVRHLGLSEHREVARATYYMGQIAAELGHDRPWTEGQLGYLMPEEQANLLRQARESTPAGAAS